LNPVSVNDDPVIMARRTLADFSRVDKLKNEVPVVPKTSYDLYLGHKKKASVGKFANDPQR
jgi:hypothetical protein